MVNVVDILEIVSEHNSWRFYECVNLVASENVMSPLAFRLLLSDFEFRYNEHDGESHYQGTKYAMSIESVVKKIFGARFNTRFVEPRPLSGGIANAIVFSSLARYGDVYLSVGLTAGAHVSHTRFGVAGILGLKEIEGYFDVESFTMDVDKTIALAERVNPKFIVVGRSVILFPEPIWDLHSALPDVPIVYDASHVFGLIWGGEFQDPFRDGAVIITSSTHKTFPGPQGGIIIGAGSLDENVWVRIERRTFPGFVYNHHINRFPALAVTALEMNAFGREYASQIVRNAKKLAAELSSLGFKVLGEERGFTRSHQVLVDVRKFGGGLKVAKLLEESNIIVTKIALPWDKPRDATSNPSGIRIGVQEVTRFGMKESEMKEIAKFFEDIIIKGKDVKSKVVDFRKRFLEVKYGYGVEGYESYLMELF